MRRFALGLTLVAALEDGRMVIPRQADDIHQPEDKLLVFASNGTMTEMPLDDRCINAHVVYAVPGWPDAVLVVCEGHHIEPGTLVMIDLSTGAVLSSAQAGVFPDAAAWVIPW